MPVYRLPTAHLFPDPNDAEPSGLLAVGGDLEPSRMLLAYCSGIFPWYSEGQPILWFSPDPRYVLYPERLHVGRSLAKIVRRGDYEIRVDTAFEAVVANCQSTPRPGQYGTWITEAMRRSLLRLHQMGVAHSFEAYQDGRLVGGLYGLSIGSFFAGESMFAHAPDASKVAFVWAVAQLRGRGVGLIDCQVETEHLARFGAVHISRKQYLSTLAPLVAREVPPERWTLNPDFVPGR